MLSAGTEIDLLARAHALFAGQPGSGPLQAAAPTGRPPDSWAGPAAASYRAATAAIGTDLLRAGHTDTELAAILAAARRDHAAAGTDTRAVLAAARAEAGVVADNPLAARELLRRRVLRLRRQRGHVLSAVRRARRRRSALRALAYRRHHRARRGAGPRAAAAVRAAMSRLGCPYVWGATGPDRFDCSGLVRWAYAQAGVPLSRTTYDQISQGVAVARSEVRPGDLVFPHRGHVQMAIGGGQVIEAPYAGAAVRIAPLGDAVAIRRLR